MSDPIEQMLAMRARCTPTVGVNLCEIDDYDFPARLIFLGNYPNKESAQRAQNGLEQEDGGGHTYTLIYPDGE